VGLEERKEEILVRRLRRSIAIGAALTLLLLGAPVDGAAAAPKDRSPSQQGGQDDERRAAAAADGPSAGEQGGQGDEQRADPANRPPRNRPQPPRSSGTPAHAAATVACGQTITRDTTLTADVGPCQGEGIIVGADNIRLNLNGRRVLGNSDQGASGEFAGIRLAGRTGVTVTGHPGKSGKKGTVSGFEAGVVIDGGSANTVENLTARDNIGLDDAFNAELGDGIIIFDSPSNRILNNVVVHNGIFDGIGVLGKTSDNNIIQGNTVDDTVGPTPDGGSSVGGPAGQGIAVNGADGSNRETIAGTKIEGNTIRRNASAGISNINNVDGSILGNTIEGNGLTNSAGNGIGIQAGLGFRIQFPTRILVQGNEVHGNAENGISVRANASENRIIDNDAADNNAASLFRRTFDLHDENRDCDSNVWSGNIWGTGLFNTACVTAGGSGPPFPLGPEGPLGDPTCRDQLDNDQDGDTDRGDPACTPQPEGPEGDPSCFDGIDNNYDDATDGDDLACGGEGNEPGETEFGDSGPVPEIGLPGFGGGDDLGGGGIGLEPAPIGLEPAPTEPAPIGLEPAPTEPAPTEPAPTEPAPTEPAPTEPAPTEPAPTEPAPTEPAPTEPAPTEPAPTEPAGPLCFGEAAGPRANGGVVIIGTEGDDTLAGTDDPDLICGLGGNDDLSGLAGDDRIEGGAGDDQLFGGAGNDELRGGAGADNLFGEAGDDQLFGGADNDGLLVGGDGSDTINGDDGDDSLTGDRIFGGGAPGNDVLLGGLGTDSANGGEGTDRCEAETSTNCES
jgi:parallel beta-helix repeat protein